MVDNFLGYCMCFLVGTWLGFGTCALFAGRIHRDEYEDEVYKNEDRC